MEVAKYKTFSGINEHGEKVSSKEEGEEPSAKDKSSNVDSILIH